jgi:hypothetical protein
LTNTVIKANTKVASSIKITPRNESDISHLCKLKTN